MSYIRRRRGSGDQPVGSRVREADKEDDRAYVVDIYARVQRRVVAPCQRRRGLDGAHMGHQKRRRPALEVAEERQYEWEQELRRRREPGDVSLYHFFKG